MATPCFFYGGPVGPPEGAVSGKALAVSLSPSSARNACTLKGGCLSIVTQGSYRLSGPHPLVLSMASRPGMPAMAKTSPRAGTRGCRVSSSNPACALKGGCLSIATQGSYRLSSPHPLALPTASRLGKPATAETSSRAGTRGRRVSTSNPACALKGGPEHCDLGLLPALQPSPSGLVHGIATWHASHG